MTSFFRAAANFVGLSSEQVDDNPEFTAKLDGFKGHIAEIQKVRDALQLYSDAAEAMLAAQVVLGEVRTTLHFLHSNNLYLIYK
jgi:hypothetical protein